MSRRYAGVLFRDPLRDLAAAISSRPHVAAQLALHPRARRKPHRMPSGLPGGRAAGRPKRGGLIIVSATLYACVMVYFLWRVTPGVTHVVPCGARRNDGAEGPRGRPADSFSERILPRNSRGSRSAGETPAALFSEPAPQTLSAGLLSCSTAARPRAKPLPDLSKAPPDSDMKEEWTLSSCPPEGKTALQAGTSTAVARSSG